MKTGILALVEFCAASRAMDSRWRLYGFEVTTIRIPTSCVESSESVELNQNGGSSDKNHHDRQYC